jgi:hypothetical protein
MTALITTEQLETKALTWAQQAQAIVIKDEATYLQASEMLTGVVALKKEAIAHHKPMKDTAKRAHEAACDAERRVVEPLKAAEEILRPAVTAYQVERDRRIEEENRRNREEAARKQREEDERYEREMAAQQEAARQREEEQRLADAAQAQAEGASAEEVDAILETPAPIAAYVEPVQPPRPVMAAVIPQTYARAAGVSKPRDNWSCEVVNLYDLVKYAATNPEWTGLLMANMTALNSLAKAQKQLLNIPGIKAVNNQTISVGGKR